MKISSNCLDVMRVSDEGHKELLDSIFTAPAERRYLFNALIQHKIDSSHPSNHQKNFFQKTGDSCVLTKHAVILRQPYWSVYGALFSHVHTVSQIMFPCSRRDICDLQQCSVKPSIRSMETNIPPASHSALAFRFTHTKLSHLMPFCGF